MYNISILKTSPSWSLSGPARFVSNGGDFILFINNNEGEERDCVIFVCNHI